jgi:signal transduction histidine kinase
MSSFYDNIRRRSQYSVLPKIALVIAIVVLLLSLTTKTDQMNAYLATPSILTAVILSLAVGLHAFPSIKPLLRRRLAQLTAVSAAISAAIVVAGMFTDGETAQWLQHLIDPETAVCVILVSLPLAKRADENEFRNLTRYVMCLGLGIVGIILTPETIIAAMMQTVVHPVVVSSPIGAVPLCIIAAIRTIQATKGFSRPVLNVSLAIAVLAYLLLSSIYANLILGQIGYALFDLFLFAVFSFGLNTLVNGMDEYFRLIDGLERRNNQLSRQNHVIQDLLYALAHDLRSPARGIVQSAEWLREDLNKGKIKEAETRAFKIADRAETLYERMEAFVEYVRLGGFTVNRVPIRFDTLVVQILQAVPQIPQLQVKLAGPKVLLHSDESALSGILSNLIDNAIRFANPDHPEITIKWRIAEQQLHFEVIDNGVGIPVAMQTKLFQPFRTTGAPASQQGMGLAISARMVEALHGEITLHSQPNEKPGTTLKVTVPVGNYTFIDDGKAAS